MLITVRHLQLRNRRYRYRREVPADLRAKVGKREWIVQLDTDSATVAARKAEKLKRLHDLEIERLRGTSIVLEARAVLDDPQDDYTLHAYRLEALANAIDAIGDPAEVARKFADLDDLLAAHGSRHGQAVVAAVKAGGVETRIPLSEAYKRDKEKYGGKRDEKRIKFAVDAFITDVGDRDFLNLKRADVEAWIIKARGRDWSESTIKRRTVALQGIHTRLLIGLDLPLSSAWRKLGLTDSDEKARIPFNASHLGAIEQHLASTKKSGRHLATFQRRKRMLILMKYLGLGPAEAGGLRKRDFVFSHKTPHVIIREHDDRTLKTGKIRQRTLPLIGEAIAVAREACDAADGELVFVPKDQKFDAGRMSQDLAKEIRAAGIPKSPRLVPYSFRHGFEEAMKLAKVRPGLMKYAMGHAASGISDKYGAPAPLLAELSKELKRAYRYFGHVDDSIYEPHELMPTISR